MSAGCKPRMQWRIAAWAITFAPVFCIGAAGGCTNPPAALWWSPTSPQPAESPAPDDALSPDDNPLVLVPTGDGKRGRNSQATQLGVVLTVLHVQVPRSQRELVEPLWNHLREDVLASEDVLRLRNNGMRVGVGHAEWWTPIKAILDSADGVLTHTLDPVRIPPGYPLSLELDDEPHDQTLFFMAADHVLTGETWTQSRNVLRVSCGLDLERTERVHMAVVPEVRQRLAGWRWIRGESGLMQLPNYNGRAYPAAGLALALEPGQFLLVAPAEEANLYGIVGGAFLLRQQEEQLYESYVFLRADVNHVVHGD